MSDRSSTVPMTLTWLVWLLAGLQTLAAALGLFAPRIYEGLVPHHYIAESRGQDLMSLMLAVPALLFGVRGAARGSLRAGLVTAGALLYTAYVSIIYAYGGVANELYFVYVACLSLSFFCLWLLWKERDEEALTRAAAGALPRRTVALFLWIVSALLALVWGGLAVGAILKGVASEANTILVTDLAFVLPGFVLAGWWLWRREARGVLLAGSMLVLNVVLNLSIVAGQLMRVAHGLEPVWGLAALFATIGIVSALLAGVFFRRLA